MISIIMPAYNSEKYIEEAIGAICQQTYTDWELIVIDDGSTDTTWARVQQLAANKPQLRIYQNPHNLGVSATRNRAIALAQGVWLAFCDSDD